MVSAGGGGLQGEAGGGGHFREMLGVGNRVSLGNWTSWLGTVLVIWPCFDTPEGMPLHLGNCPLRM